MDLHRWHSGRVSSHLILRALDCSGESRSEQCTPEGWRGKRNLLACQAACADLLQSLSGHDVMNIVIQPSEVAEPHKWPMRAKSLPNISSCLHVRVKSSHLRRARGSGHIATRQGVEPGRESSSTAEENAMLTVAEGKAHQGGSESKGTPSRIRRVWGCYRSGANASRRMLGPIRSKLRSRRGVDIM